MLGGKVVPDCHHSLGPAQAATVFGLGRMLKQCIKDGTAFFLAHSIQSQGIRGVEIERAAVGDGMRQNGWVKPFPVGIGIVTKGAPLHGLFLNGRCPFDAVGLSHMDQLSLIENLSKRRREPIPGSLLVRKQRIPTKGRHLKRAQH